MATRSPRSSQWRSPPRRETWRAWRRFLPSLRDQYGTSVQWAEPVTGSSSMPNAGAKNRETKSTSPGAGGGHDHRAVEAFHAAPCRARGRGPRPPTRTPPGSRARTAARPDAARAPPRRRRAAGWPPEGATGSRGRGGRLRRARPGRRWRSGTALPCAPSPAPRRRRAPRPGWRGRRGRSPPPASSSECCSRPSPPTRKAVSARLFSAAIFCITSSGSQAASGHTAAGFPVNTPSVTKASMWWMGISMGLLSEEE